jgi:hypothetical protein
MAQVNASDLIDDIELQLNQGTISDDTELSRTQIAYWLEVELNFMVRQECDAAVKAGKLINPIYIQRGEGYLSYNEPFFKVESLTAIGENTSIPYVFTLDTSKFYKLSPIEPFYMEMTPKEAEDLTKRQGYALDAERVLDLYNDAGIIRVMTEDYEMINKASVETIQMMEHLRFAGPTKNLPVYVRRGNSIFIEGMTASRYLERKFLIDYVAYQSINDGDLALQIGDVILPSVIDRALQRGKLQMYGSTADMSNDGEDYKQSVYHTAIQNPAKGEASMQ